MARAWGLRTSTVGAAFWVPGTVLLLSVMGCTTPAWQEGQLPHQTPSLIGPSAPIRQSGVIGSGPAIGAPIVSYERGASSPAAAAPIAIASSGPPVALDFDDTDIRAVAAQVLGSQLQVNYTIDPNVRGNVTFHAAAPIPRAELLPTLQLLLRQAGAALIQQGTTYAVVPAAAAASSAGLAATAAAGGDSVVQLRYASAEELARVLQPLLGNEGRVAAYPGANAVIIGGDPIARESLVNLVRSFDVRALSHQSLALLPVPQGSVREVADALRQALDRSGGAGRAPGSAPGLVNVIPMERMSSVLVSASDPSMIDEARRVFGVMQQQQRATTASWYVYFLQNGRSDDIAHILQQAFTPNHVTALPTAPNQIRPSGIGIQPGGSALGGAQAANGGAPAILSGNAAAAGGQGGVVAVDNSMAQALGTTAANPLLGGLDAPSGGGAAGANTDTMRIIPSTGNNAILIYGTPKETDTVLAMLRRIDILPLQVRIDAVVAEVELNDSLQYGTQFFFKSGGLNGTLSQVFNAGNAFGGYYLAGSNAAQVALNLLQAVSTVHVLSSPQLMVLDNQPARLRVGDLVPYLTQQSQSTLTSTSPLINSVQYQQTGVVLDVTPRVNSSNLVTLDISQEVSNVDTAATTQFSSNGISSPTFLQRGVQSRVVVQDGQTIGLAGLILDSSTLSNQGVPFLKDVPVLGALFGQQNNTRTRTELMVLITPHVIHDQRDALMLTQDMREQMPNAALVPSLLQNLRPSGSDDPNRGVRRALDPRP